ncbi:MAG: hypothetical protein K8T25_02355 [Planctomycetia bacterium]|nr:hypothetical protein [Planctomycetia bacterium]
MIVFPLWHGHDLKYMDDYKLIGIYSTEEAAKAAQRRASEQPGFRDHLDGFFMEAYEVDKDHWTEGFVTE